MLAMFPLVSANAPLDSVARKVLDSDIARSDRALMAFKSSSVITNSKTLPLSVEEVPPVKAWLIGSSLSELWSMNLLNSTLLTLIDSENVIVMIPSFKSNV